MVILPRKSIYIDKKFQGIFLFKFTGLLILIAFLSLLILWFIKLYSYDLFPGGASVLVDLNFKELAMVSQTTNGVYEKDIKGDMFVVSNTENLNTYNAFDLYMYPIILISAINIVCIFIFTLFFSHKIAGPIYHLKKNLKIYLETGEYKPIHFREKDFLQDVSPLINDAVQKNK